MIWGITLKAQYYLANTASGDTTSTANLKPAYWPGIGFFGNRRKRMVERYNVTVEVLEEELLDDNVNVQMPPNEKMQVVEKDASMTRWIFYEMLEKMSKE